MRNERDMGMFNELIMRDKRNREDLKMIKINYERFSTHEIICGYFQYGRKMQDF